MAYNKKASPTIDAEIIAFKKNQFIFSNLYKSYNKDGMIFKKDSILENYRDVILSECLDLDLSDLNGIYKYKPKLLSYDLYGTIDLWWLILWVNDMGSSRQFIKDKVRVFSPQSLDILNKIYIIEKEKLNSSQDSPILI